MHDQGINSGLLYDTRKGEKGFVRILIIYPNPAFDGHRNSHTCFHGSNTIGDQRGFRHQTRAEPANLNAIGWTPHIEIDFVVAKLFANTRRQRERLRITSAELECNRVLERIKRKQSSAIAVQDGASGQHLGVNQRAPRQQPVKEPTVAIGPLHHRSDTKAPTADFSAFL
jgi:hypothetical protein